jgi:hypothetical protein
MRRRHALSSTHGQHARAGAPTMPSLLPGRYTPHVPHRRDNRLHRMVIQINDQVRTTSLAPLSIWATARRACCCRA